jgi:hypothetical protein
MTSENGTISVRQTSHIRLYSPTVHTTESHAAETRSQSNCESRHVGQSVGVDRCTLIRTDSPNFEIFTEIVDIFPS